MYSLEVYDHDGYGLSGGYVRVNMGDDPGVNNDVIVSSLDQSYDYGTKMWFTVATAPTTSPPTATPTSPPEPIQLVRNYNFEKEKAWNLNGIDDAAYDCDVASSGSCSLKLTPSGDNTDFIVKAKIKKTFPGGSAGDTLTLSYETKW